MKKLSLRQNQLVCRVPRQLCPRSSLLCHGFSVASPIEFSRLHVFANTRPVRVENSVKDDALSFSFDVSFAGLVRGPTCHPSSKLKTFVLASIPRITSSCLGEGGVRHGVPDCVFPTTCCGEQCSPFLLLPGEGRFLGEVNALVSHERWSTFGKSDCCGSHVKRA